MDVGYNIFKYRKLNNLSQEEFAWRLGIHRTYLGQIERAEKNITLKNINKIHNNDEKYKFFEF